MSHQKVFEQFKERAENASPLGGTLKFMVDENAIFIDGNGDQNTVTFAASFFCANELREGFKSKNIS